MTRPPLSRTVPRAWCKGGRLAQCCGDQLLLEISRLLKGGDMNQSADNAIPSPLVIGLNAVIVAVTEEVPRVLTVTRTGHALAAPEERESIPGGVVPDALPFGPLDPEHNHTLERG